MLNKGLGITALSVDVVQILKEGFLSVAVTHLMDPPQSVWMVDPLNVTEMT